jgi:hypothetical protein
VTRSVHLGCPQQPSYARDPRSEQRSSIQRQGPGGGIGDVGDGGARGLAGGWGDGRSSGACLWVARVARGIARAHDSLPELSVRIGYQEKNFTDTVCPKPEAFFFASVTSDNNRLIYSLRLEI